MYRPSLTPNPRQSGQGMLEYILIVVFIAVAGIATWKAFGQQINETVRGSSDAISGETSDVLEKYNSEK